MKVIRTAIMFSALLLTAGCASRNSLYLTQQLRDRISTYNISPEQVQYYNDRKFILQRNVTRDEARVMGGKVKFVNGQYVERVVIRKMTPGVCEEYGPDFMNISFESGDNRWLRFAVNYRGRYQISALEWRKGYGKVEYDTTFFYIMPGGDRTYLKVKKQDVFIMKKDERIAPGRTVVN
ncbi:MAG TPA: hypothetical protein PKE03_09370 [Bacteroidales bacterium]|nr:hypothetical protein [Bacteroidales bacterium]